MLVPKFKMTMQYFDRNIIKINWKKINESPLKKAGLLVRRIARGSIRQVKRAAPGPPGSPPKSRSAKRQFKLIYSLPMNLGVSVIVGMVGFGATNPVPGLQEHGGTAMRNVLDYNPAMNRINRQQRRDRRRETKLAPHLRDPKVMALGLSYQEMIRQKNWKRNPFKKATMARVMRPVVYPERPFMVPALNKALPSMPAFWKNTIG